MTRSLPSTPNLRYLKEESKDILKAHKNGDASCCGTLRHLRQFKRKTDKEVLQARIGLQEVQFALALEYEFRSWDDLKRFVEHVQKTGAKTEQELNMATLKAWFDGMARGEWRNYLMRTDELMHYDEEVRTWDEIDRMCGDRLDLKRKHVIEDIAADGDKVSARVVSCGPVADGTEREINYTGTWRFIGGRFAEAWLPQGGALREDHTGPADTRPAMTRLDKEIAASPYVPEINYVNSLLHHLARSAPASVTIRESEALPEIRDQASDGVILASHEHVFLRLRTMTRETTRIHVREQGHDFIARVSFGDEPEETWHINVERYTPDKIK